MTDDEMMALAREAAVAEAKRLGWLAPGDNAPAEDPTTAESVLVGMLAAAEAEPEPPVVQHAPVDHLDDPHGRSKLCVVERHSHAVASS